MDPRLPFVAVESLASVIRPEILPYRLGASLFGLFGVLALILAGVGLYGSLGYFVAERRPEIGIRRSLGAEERHVVGLVLREGMLPVVGGLAVGLVAAAAGVRLVESLLFGVAARDLASFVAAAFFLTCVAAAASYLPARRAARVDPMVALRAQ
jgi:ABC-type antimicrobial peptide transport system permease subunit